MATTIKLKNGSGAPLAGDLVQGEPALDLTNKRLYTEDAGGSVIEIGTSPSTIDINAGTIDGVTLGTNSPVTSAVITTADINGGTIDNAVIGGSTAAAGTFTTGQFNTSVNVDGTVTADGATIDGNLLVGDTDNAESARLNVQGGYIFLKETNGGDVYLRSGYGGSTDPAIQVSSADPLLFLTTNTPRMKIDAGGDISFYEDTGTTPKFFWDASAEYLSVGGTTGTFAPINYIGSNGRLGINNGNTSGGTKIQSFAATNANGYLAFEGWDKEYMRITSAGNVGIGTSSPSADLHINGTTTDIRITNTTNTSGFDIGLLGGDSNDNGYVWNRNAGSELLFGTNNAEAMRIDSSGNLLVGTTDTNIGTNSGINVAGNYLDATGTAVFGKNGNRPLILNRGTNDGNIAEFRKDGTTVGSIGSRSSTYLYIGSPSTNGAIGFVSGSVRPVTATGSDNNDALDLGASGVAWDDVYATNGTIQTSDRNEKQDIEALSEAEQRVAVACKGLLRKFRWKSKVAEKGDDARIHFGIIAQDLQAAFEAEGLDAGRYAMFIHSTWTDEETGEERSRMGVRYSELLAFIISAI